MNRILGMVISFVMLIICLPAIGVSADAVVGDGLFPAEIAAEIFACKREADPVINNGGDFVFYENYVFYVKDEGELRLYRLDLNTKETVYLDSSEVSISNVYIYDSEIGRASCRERV